MHISSIITAGGARLSYISEDLAAWHWTLIPAASAMLERNISCLPVVKDGRLCGVLTTTDLIMTLQCCLQTLHQVLGQLAPQQDEPEGRESLAAGRAPTISELCRAGSR